MSSRAFSLLVPEMQLVAEKVQECLDVLIYCTVRSAEEQARLWRQSRPTKTIVNKINQFKSLGRDDLAEILEKVGPQYGPHVTYCCCGESYHQYGLAFDAVPMNNGKLMWSVKDPRWKDYAKILEDLGVIWGGNWPNFRDFPHAQLYSRGNPMNLGMKLVTLD